jgi:hypothetical protein
MRCRVLPIIHMFDLPVLVGHELAHISVSNLQPIHSAVTVYEGRSTLCVIVFDLQPR